MGSVLICMVFWTQSGSPIDTVTSPITMSLYSMPVLPERAPFDPWFSKDKFLHVCGSAGLCGIIYHMYAARLQGDIDQGGVFSVSLTGFIAVSKELYDRSRNGTFSWKDLVWDAFGIAAGYLVFVR